MASNHLAQKAEVPVSYTNISMLNLTVLGCVYVAVIFFFFS